MNIRDNFPGHGMTAAEAALRADDALAAQYDSDLEADIAEDLAKELPTQSLIDGSRWAFEKTIAAEREEKAKQQRIASAATAKIRQLTASIRSKEDALDALLVAES